MSKETFEEWWDCYDVNKKGEVFSKKLDRKLKPQITKKGYSRIGLYLNKKTRGKLVHRMVAEKYIPNPENKKTVNHIDGDKLNNKVENLEWCTHLENMKHGYETGLIDGKRNVGKIAGEKHHRAIFKKEDILKIRELHKSGMRQVDIARLFKAKKGAIWAIAHNHNWK